MMQERFTRTEAAAFIPCSLTKLFYLEKSGVLEGCYYLVGRRKFYIVERLRAWQEAGGERV